MSLRAQLKRLSREEWSPEVFCVKVLGTARLTLSLSQIKKRMVGNLGGLIPKKITEKTINDSIWPMYRSVAAYWAAYSVVGPEWPCTTSTLDKFLAIAEEFRRRGEATRGRQSPEPTILRR